MTRLIIYSENLSGSGEALMDTNDVNVISAQLDAIGVKFERWIIQQKLPEDAKDQDVLHAYEKDIARLKNEGGYQSVDVVRIFPNNPKKEELRSKFLNEHTHSEDEVRFFVEGTGMFYLHANDNVYMVLCESGDLVNVPAWARHWFDMGPEPNFTCIRLFTRPDGWAAEFTGDKIADKFPKFESKAA